MSNAVETDIIALVEKELKAANEKYPLFASPHEAYAVILEEIEECQSAMAIMTMFFSKYWHEIKENESRVALATEIGSVQLNAIQLAIEAIQVAAMCRKFEMSFPRGEEKAK